MRRGNGARIEDEQILKILLGEMDRLSARVKVFGIDDGAAEPLFGNLALEDLFLDCAGREKAINANDAFLAIAPHASHRLEVIGRIPVDIVQNQRRSACR